MFNEHEVIYVQIERRMLERIASGEWEAGERMPTVRELAQVYRVNPNTVQRALAELERSGYCRSERSSGRFITADLGLIDRLREELAAEAAEAFLEKMERLKIAPGRALPLLRELLEREKTKPSYLPEAAAERARSEAAVKGEEEDEHDPA